MTLHTSIKIDTLCSAAEVCGSLRPGKTLNCMRVICSGNETGLERAAEIESR